MKVEIDTKDKKIAVRAWYSSSHEGVLRALRTQLKAAIAVWPEMEKYTIEERADPKKFSPQEMDLAETIINGKVPDGL